MTFRLPRFFFVAVLPATLGAVILSFNLALVSAASDPYQAGFAALKAGRYASAVADFNLAIKHHERLADSYAGLGSAELRLGKLPRAYSAYTKAATLAPRIPANLYGAAYTAYALRKWNTAIAFASRLIAVEPRSSGAYHLRMLAYDYKGDVKAQLADALKVVQLVPKNPQAFNDLGIAYSNNKKLQQAVLAFNRAIALDKSVYTFYANRSVVEIQMKDLQRALTDLETARRYAPNASAKRVIDQRISALKKQINGGH